MIKNKLNIILIILLSVIFFSVAVISNGCAAFSKEEEKQKETIDTDKSGADVLKEWLEDHPQVSGTILWWEPGAGWVNYDSWSTKLKASFLESFQALWEGTPLAISDIPENQAILGDEDLPETYLKYDDARNLYFSLIGQSLLTELKGLVSWSLEEYRDNNIILTQLFSPWILYDLQVYCLPSLTSLGPESESVNECDDVAFKLVTPRTLPAPGYLTYTLLNDGELIGDDQLKSIVNMLEWARSNMCHFYGQRTASVAEYYWNYRGDVPTLKVFEGTDPEGTHPQDGPDSPFGHWTAGCLGTTGFFQEMLRVINIPVLPINVGHAFPYFMSEGVYLSHGDDPYDRMCSTADYTADLLLINEEKYVEWFGDPSTAMDNIGRRVTELAAIYLPTELLKMRCEDLEAGLSNEDGSIYVYLEQAYSMEQLNEMDFWANIDDKIEEHGGCEYIQ